MFKRFGRHLAIVISALVIIGTVLQNYNVNAMVTKKKSVTNKKTHIVVKNKSKAAKKTSKVAKKPSKAVKKPAPASKKPSTATTKPKDTTSNTITDNQNTTTSEVEVAPKWTIDINNNGSDISFTDIDANKIQPVQIDTVLKKKDGSEEKQTWIGITLKSVLQYYNISDFNTIVAEGSDGYKKEYTTDLVNADGTIFGLEADGKELDNEAGPVELVASGQPGSMWIKKLSKLTITASEAKVTPKWTIDIKNNGSDISFTDLDAKKIGTVQIDAVLKKKDGSELKQTWTGVTLKAVLQYYNISDYKTIDAEASDGYKSEYTPDLVNSDGTILGFEADGKELDNEAGPVELVVNGQPGSMWIKLLNKITVNK